MTNRELAQKLGISPTAFSLIINHKPGVSDFTRESVLSKLKEMGLESLIRKAPSTGGNNLCFIIYKRHGKILDLHPFFLLLIEYIEEQARSYGYNIQLTTIDKRRPLPDQIAHVNELNSQGAILFATEMEAEDIEAFESLSIPYVALDNDFSTQNCNTISINNQMGTYQAISYLVKNNLTRIGYLKSNIRINSFAERQLGYETALKTFGLGFASSDIIEMHYTEEGSYRDMKDYLETVVSLPQAFVCDDDTMAQGSLLALKEHGLRVPDDVSVIGFNDRPACELTNPPLTSVNVSKHTLALEAVDELIRLIENREQHILDSRSRKIRIGTTLSERSSVRLSSL